MKKQPHTKSQSRRQVQRRFPPGEFLVSKESNSIIGTIVGWSAIRAEHNPRTGELRRAQDWEVLVLDKKNTLYRRGWWSMQDMMNFEEWEDWVTTP